MSGPDGQQARRQLLVIDDDPRVSRMMAMIATGAGFEVTCAQGPEQFFAALEGESPSHVAVDLLMPELDGVEILRELAARRCRARVIITSGMGSHILEAALRLARERGLNVKGILPKPFYPQTLRALLTDSPTDAEGGAALLIAHGIVIDEGAIRVALNERQFRIALQPQVDRQLRLRGFEVLVRWDHPTAGEILPEQFMPLAESTAGIHYITVQVAEDAIDWLVREFPASEVRLGLNLAHANFANAGLVDHLAWLCRDRGLSPRRLELEIAEAQAPEQHADMLDMAARLRLKEFSVVLDHYGSSQALLTNLTEMPLTGLKLDRSLVSTVTDRPPSLTAIQSITRLASTLGLDTTAVGVASRSALDLLLASGCRNFQGRFVAPAMTPVEVSRWLCDEARRPGIDIA
jgi:EAL domain-containing protein (putative c-di-GMP-specific phosphodiesterase class I)/ActR/RegA family two-component response regulator